MDSRSSGWFRFNVSLHRWASLLATPFFLVLCVTGTILIFHEEIDDALGVVPKTELAAGHTVAPISRMVAAAKAKSPDAKPMFVFFDEHDPARLAVGMAPKGSRKLDQATLSFFNTGSGELLQSVDPGKTLTGFVLEWHAQWFLGLPGQLFSGLVGLAVLLSLLSGLVVYAPYAKRVAFGEVRRARGQRVAQLDLHNLVGVVVLGWALVVSATGVLLTLGSIAVQVYAMTELKEMASMVPAVANAANEAGDAGIDKVIESARATRPNRRLTLVAFPGTDISGERTYTALMAGVSGYDQKLFDVAVIDAAQGTVNDTRPAPWYLKAILLSEPLHFGDYGGLPLKLLWTACAWLTMFIVGNGAWLWWSRRVPRKRKVLLEGTT
jgi:uncharacterized iron-regulated membrane protein